MVDTYLRAHFAVVDGAFLGGGGGGACGQCACAAPFYLHRHSRKLSHTVQRMRKGRVGLAYWSQQ